MIRYLTCLSLIPELAFEPLEPTMYRSSLFRYSIFALFGFVWILGNPDSLPAQNPAQEIGFVEQYALSTDREKTLERLVPGTETYYYFHCLHYLTTEQLDKAEEMLKPWIKRFGRTNRVNLIRNRLAILKYSDNPTETLEFLRKELGLDLNHQREIPQTQRDLPTQLNDQLISLEILTKQALTRRNTESLTDAGLELLSGKTLSKDQRRHLLQRLRYPDYPGLVKLVVDDLKQRDSGGFGRINIHRQLTIAQLDESAHTMPKLLDHNEFVNTYLSKLHPTNDVNWRVDVAEHRAFLDRLWKFVSPLNPKFNSLKACVLYRQLELDRRQGKYDKRKFMTYLRLPRQVGYVNPELIKAVASRDHIVNLNADYRSQLLLVPVQNDEPLVRDFLQHFLRDANDESQFRPFVRTPYLKTQLATTKILNGLGDNEKWASLLSPKQYQDLVDRIDLDFVSTNPEFYAVDDQVQLELFTKNVQNLIVKIYEINTHNYYLKYGCEIDTDISLDGLVPNHEQTFEYKEAPALRVKRRFTLDQIKGPGVFVVDFIGNGKSSRALIRKSRLSMIGEVTVAGHRFKVIDESSKLVKNAELTIGGRRYSADKNGQIIVPFTSSPDIQAAIIRSGDFNCLQSFKHLAETYSLDAALLVDRESLLRSNETQILVRPRIAVAGHPVTTKLLENVQLLITSVNLDGLSSTKRINDLKLGTNAETVCKFLVPPRLKSLSLKLSAEVKNISQNRTENVVVEKSFAINAIDESDEIQDVHLAPTKDGYAFEVLGKSGEPRVKQAVRVKLSVNGFKDPVIVDLQSNKNGLVQLGKLPNVNFLKASLVGGSERTWEFRIDQQSFYQTIDAMVGQEITIPALENIITVNRNRLSLIEVRRGTYTHDHSSAIKVANGMITISGLDRGDYRLRLKDIGKTITLRVTDGTPFDNVLIGPSRQLETRGGRPVHITELKATQDKIQLTLGNVNDWTRVHVIGSRYMPSFGAYGLLSEIRDIEPSIYTPPVRRSVYMAGRKIGDEYQYILDRKYGNKYPGNMLERPSLLLNPWELRDTQNKVEELAEGAEYGGVGNEPDDEAGREASEKQQGSANSDFANLDFLSKGSTFLANLVPDKNGTVTIDRKQLGNRQHVRFIVLDSFSTIERSIRLPLENRVTRDLRLANAMDPSQHFSQTKQIDILKDGEKFKIDDILSARFQHYDDLGDVFRLLNTLNGGALSEFEFILGWPDYDIEKKRELYSKHACHELNFFLIKKDPEFFQDVVTKHLRYKRDKTFVDRWLLNDNVDDFVDPWKYARLNVFERILLAQRLEDRGRDIQRNIGEMYLLQPTPRAAFGKYFDTSLIVSTLDFDDNGNGFDRRKLQLLVDASQIIASERSLDASSELFAGQARRQPALAELKANLEIASKTESKGALGVETPVVLNSLEARPQDFAGKPGQGGRFRGGASGAIAEGALGYAFKSRADLGRSVIRYRKETRSRPGKDGTIEEYEVEVPYAAYTPYGEEQGNESLFGWRDKQRALFRRLGATKEWIENNYWHLPPDQPTTKRVQTNRFWRDYANHVEGPFISPYFPEANRNLTEMIFALAVIDLPFKGPEHKFVYDDSEMTLTPAGPMIALHQQVRPAVFDRQNTTVLVSENFFQKNDRYRFEDGVQYDKFVTGEFIAHTLYGGQVVITNPTSTPQAIDLLHQLPKGAVIASGSQETRNIPIDLAGFSTQTFEYYFYFPAAGDFTHFPAHVSKGDRVMAVADPVEFKVTDKPAELDKTSWAFVSQNGSADEVIEFINQQNVLRLDLNKIAFRMKDKSFFERAIKTLRNRYVYNHILWSYSILHNDKQSIRELLSHADSFVKACGIYFQSELLPIDPIERSWYFHSEYWPLVNSRSHRVGPKRTILNPEFHRQYHRLMDVLSNRRELTDDDHLVVTYYMLLQDRIDEAFAHFGRVDLANIECNMQYAYCNAYLDMYREQPEAAAAKAQLWTDYPVVHWGNRFKEILAQVDEIRGGAVQTVDDKSNKQKQTELAASAPSFDFDVESSTAKIGYQNIDELTVNYYEMDIELLFSRRPFAQDELDGFSMIRPNLTQSVKLPSVENNEPGTHEFVLPAELKNKNVLVEIVAGDQTKSKPYFSNSLAVQLIETYGQLRVTSKAGGAPIAKAYVKVYSRSGGSVKFHKDGYTDLRGRFDYVSQSNNSIDGIEKYSILVMHPENGAVIKQGMPPQE